MEIDKRDLLRTVPSPPSAPGRKCSGERYVPPAKPFVNYNKETVDGHDGYWKPCEVGCNAFVPEVDYCANHLPVEWVVTAQRRKELWASLLWDVWVQVCSEFPGPES